MHNDGKMFCNERHHKMERFMEICLLLLLYKGGSHGYGLIEELSYFGFSQEKLNVSTLYRTLRKLEKEGLVLSIWEEGDQGPKKRVYNITDSGKEELQNWIQVLKIRKTRIEKLIEKYEETIELNK